ncbi:PLD-like domain-containing protein [Rhizobiales bacterium GAS113]|nr:PLD-like domain-containing protein [Rhizobiales bacterium GAS113]
MSGVLEAARLVATIRLIVALAACVLALPAWAGDSAYEIHRAPFEDLEKIDVRLISEARRNIDMAAFVLTDAPVINALAAAAARGVQIRVYLDAGQYAQHGREAAGPMRKLLATVNVQAKVKGSRVLMHLKAYDVDGELLRTGAGNLSSSGLTQQDNDMLILFDHDEIEAFRRDFDRMWDRPSNRSLEIIVP